MSGECVAVVLAAGVGSRLRPITDDRPKCLVPLGAETLLGRLLRQLATCGWVDRAVVVTGYRHAQIAEAVRGAPLPVTCIHNPAYDSTQNAVSLHLALEALPPASAFVKFDGDLVLHPSVFGRMAPSARSGRSACGVDPRQPVRDEAMKARIDRGRITAFGKGLADGDRVESIGMEAFDQRDAATIRTALDRAVRAGRIDAYYEDVYADVLDALDLEPVVVPPDAWAEIDDLEDLARARARFSA